MTKINIPQTPKPHKHTRTHKRRRRYGALSPAAISKKTSAQSASSLKTIRHKVRHRVRLAIAPVEANQYRPRLVGRFGIAILFVGIIIAQMIYGEMTTGSVLGVKRDVNIQGLLDDTNQARTSQGEPALKLNDDLSRAAQMKANDMFRAQYWSHVSPDGTTPWHWFREVGYEYSHAGENLAKNFNTSGSVLSAWLASPTHRANVLNTNYTEVGFAVVDGQLNGDDTTLVVALYGDPVVEMGAVQGTMMNSEPKLTTSEVGTSMSFMTRMGLSIQSMSPVTISSLVLLFVAINIALIAHIYRRRLPIALQRSWYRHHGLYKAVGFFAVAVILVVAYGNIGQI